MEITFNKENKKYFVYTTYHSHGCFAGLFNKSGTLKKEEYGYSKFYNDFEKANEFAKKLTLSDMPSMVIGMELIDKTWDKKRYEFALDTPSLKDEYYERKITILSSEEYKEIFNEEFDSSEWGKKWK